MHISVTIAGLARSLEHCLPTVERKITGSLKFRASVHVSQTLTLAHSTRPLDNPRTGETLPPYVDPRTLESQTADLFLLENIREEASYFFNSILQKGEWLEGSGRNLRNYMEFLTILKKAGESVVRTDADIVVFVRPDLLVLDRFNPFKTLPLGTDKILTPRWGKFLGLNDRMAVLPRQLVRDYFYRIDTVEEFVSIHGAFDPEKHLAWTLRNTPNRATLATELIRVRAGGVLSEKDLERLETSGPYRRAQARKLRQTYPAR